MHDQCRVRLGILDQEDAERAAIGSLEWSHEAGAGSDRRAVDTGKVASMRSHGAAVCSATAT
jgi:hypothetical protein